MDVDHPETRDGEDRVGEDPPVGGDDPEVGVPGGERVQKRLVLHPRRLKDRQARRQRARLHRRVGHLLTAAARLVGLGHDTDHGVRGGGEQGVERRHGKLGRAENDDAQRRHRGRNGAPHLGLRRGVHHLPARVSFWILRTIRSRLMPRSRSTNSAPSR